MLHNKRRGTGSPPQKKLKEARLQDSSNFCNKRINCAGGTMMQEGKLLMQLLLICLEKYQ